MLSGVLEAAGKGDRLRDRDFSAPVEFAGLLYLSANDEIRFFEIFCIDDDHGVTKYLAVRFVQQVGKLRQCLSCRQQVPYIEEADVSVWLHDDGLIEFRRERKCELKGVAWVHSVAPTPLLQGRMGLIGRVCRVFATRKSLLFLACGDHLPRKGTY